MPERTTRVSLIAEANSYISNMQESARATREVAEQGRRTQEQLQKQSEAYNLIGRAGVAAGTAVLAGSALAVRAAIEWQSAWIGVTKTVEGTPEQLADVEDGLRSMTRTLPATHAELAGVAEAAGQLGVKAGSILDFTRTMVDLGQTTNLSADEAATSIAQLMNIMQTLPEDVDRVGSSLVALGNNGASTERDIVQMAQRIAGAGKVIGLTEGEVLGFANALASAGIEVEAGGSAISNIMTDIAKSVSAGGDKLELFASVAGMSADEFATAFKTAPAEAITSFIEGLGRVNATGGDVFATLDNLGQSDVRVSRALLGMANSGDLLRDSLELGNQAWKDNNALTIEAEKRYASVESQLAIARNGINDAAIDFGTVFLPAVSAAAAGVSDITDDFVAMHEPMQAAVAITVALAGAATLSGGAFMLAVPSIARYRAALATLGPTAQRVNGLLTTVGKSAGFLAVVGIEDSIVRWIDGMVGATTTAEALSTSLEKTTDRSKAVVSALEGGGKAFNFAGADLSVSNLNALLNDQGNILADLQNSWAGTAVRIASLGTSDSSLGNAKKNLEELDAAMAQLVASGNTNAAERAFQLLVDKTDGSEESIRRLKELLPEYSDAEASAVKVTRTAADAYVEAADNAAALEDELRKLIDSVNAANGVGQDAVSTNAAYQASLAEVDSFIQQARDGVEGFTFGLDENTATGSANAEMLRGLSADSQAAALAQFQLDGNTAAYKATLENGRQQVIDRAIALGATADEAQRLADKIYAIPTEAQFKVIADTATAQSQINSFIAQNQGVRLGVGVYANKLVPNETGGFYNRGVRAFESGGFPSGTYAGRPGGIHKFAEENLPWETYISPKPGHERENIGYALEALARLGFGGYASSSQSAATTTSVGGGEITYNNTFEIPPIPTPDWQAASAIIGREFARRLQ